MTRRPAAPDFVHALRALGSMTTILLYVVVRVPEFSVSPIELATTWVGALILLWVFERAASELYLRHHARQLVENAPTGPVWPTDIDTLIAESRAKVLANGGTPVIDRGVFVEPELFTHTEEFVPMHHTPARGIRFDFSDNEDAIRHRLVDAQLNRERTGQFFGDL